MLEKWLRRAASIGAVFGYVGVAVMSLVPGGYLLNVEGMSDKGEHMLAYMVLGVLTVIAARHRANAYVISLGLMTYGGFLELGQFFVPGRDPSLGDFAANAIGAIIGTFVTAHALRRSAWI